MRINIKAAALIAAAAVTISMPSAVYAQTADGALEFSQTEADTEDTEDIKENDDVKSEADTKTVSGDPLQGTEETRAVQEEKNDEQPAENAEDQTDKGSQEEYENNAEAADMKDENGDEKKQDTQMLKETDMLDTLEDAENEKDNNKDAQVIKEEEISADQEEVVLKADEEKKSSGIKEKKTGWDITKSGVFYYSEGGDPVSGIVTIDGRKYLFDNTGRLTDDGWHDTETGKVYTEDGILLSGWKNIDKKPRYFENDGTVAVGFHEISGEKFYFNNDGTIRTGLIDVDGKKYLFTEKGAAKGWNTVNGKKYYFDENGIMRTGTVSISGKKYLFNDSGNIVPGFNVFKGKLYYVKMSGEIATGTINLNGEKYFFGKDGIISSKGWIKNAAGQYYYVADGGKVSTGWISDSGKRYYMKEDGTKKTGWVKVNKKLYFLGNDGTMKTGWIKRGQKQYFFSSDGSMKTGWLTSGSKKYYFAQDGVMKTGWLNTSGKMYFFNSSGVMQKGWLKRGGNTYYMGSDGVMKKGVVAIGGKSYLFEANGRLASGITDFGNKKYSTDKNGIIEKNVWKTISGKKYYFTSDGSAATGAKKINGNTYLFSNSGYVMTGINDFGGKIYKSSVDGTVKDSIDESNIVSFIYEDGTAIAVNRNDKYVSGCTVRVPYDAKDNAQKWELIKKSDGTYWIRNVYSGVYMETNKKANALRTTFQDDVFDISWDIKKDKNEMMIPYDHKNAANPVFRIFGSARKQEITDKKDILYTDIEKEYRSVINQMKSGNTTKSYQVKCSLTDARKIINRFDKEFFQNTEGKKFITDDSIKNGRVIFDLSVGTKMYKQFKQVEKAYSEAEKKCGVTSKMSDREKVRQINRYICKNYDSVMGGSNMYQMMVKKYGSCVQHSMLFNHLCQKYGVTVENVSLKPKDDGIGHMLNRVKIGGTWYYCDINFNNGFGSDNKQVDETFLFLKSLKENPRNGYGRYDLNNIRCQPTHD